MIFKAINNHIFSNAKNGNNQNTLGGVSPSQYIKTEIDYIKHWPFGRERVFAFHGFAGIAIPYGNSTNMPFSRSYFSKYLQQTSFI